jgi:3-oxoacyl-[acyl-carrier-protein] synthase II
MARAVVITGVGAVSAMGVGAAALWAGLVEGRSGLGPVTRFDASGFASSIAGQVPAGFAGKDFVPKHYRKATKVMALDIELAVAAAKEAAESAGLVTRGMLGEDATDGTSYSPERMGCHVGAGLIAAESDELAAALVTARREQGRPEVDLGRWGESGMDNLTPLWMLKYLPNMLACHVTIIHGCEGPSNTITCGEASGLLCIGESTRVIERGAADACFSGSAESKVNFMGLLRMQLAGRLGALTAQRGPSPFDPGSPGGAIGEGGGVVVLESEQSARARGARAMARVLGTGAAQSPRRPHAGDGAPDPGVVAAIQNALDDAGLSPSEVDACVLAGSGAVGVDAGEGGALAQVMGGHAAGLPVATIGPAVGSTAAGNGGLLAVLAAMMLREQRVPARIGAGVPGGVCAALSGARGPSEARELWHVLVASSSLGGQCAAVVLGRA